MKKLLNVLVWIAIALFIWFSIEFISIAADKQSQKSDWGIAKDMPVR